MKQLTLIAALTVILAGCTHQQSRYSQTSPETATDKLLGFFDEYYEKSYDARNEIQESELFDQQQQELMKLMDSVAIFQGLSGEVSNIRKISEAKNSVTVAYNIDVEKDKNNKASLHLTCFNTFTDARSDSLYTAISSIPNYSTVYFDGVFAVDYKTNLPQYRDFGSLSFYSQYYVFNVTNISEEKTDPLSPALIDALHKARQSIMYIMRNPNMANSATAIKQKKEFDKAETKLTDEEKAYLKRYMQAMVLN